MSTGQAFTFYVELLAKELKVQRAARELGVSVAEILGEPDIYVAAYRRRMRGRDRLRRARHAIHSPLQSIVRWVEWQVGR